MRESGPIDVSAGASIPSPMSGPADLPGAADLPQVLHSAPAAVLVIDLDRRQVVHPNAAAVALAGERARWCCSTPTG